MNRLTIDEVRELLGAKKLPGSPEELNVLVEWTQDILEDKGRDYLRKHRKTLYGRWIYMLQFGISRV